MRYMKAVIKHKATGLSLGVDGLIPRYIDGIKHNPKVLYCCVGDQSAKNYVSMDVVKRTIFAKCNLEGLSTLDFVGDGYWYYNEPSIEDREIADAFIATARLWR